MIKSFACQDTTELFNDQQVRHFQSFERQARKRLMVLHAASSLNALMLNPGNMFYALKGNRQGQFAIRINIQWRICFEWHDGNIFNVAIAVPPNRISEIINGKRGISADTAKLIWPVDCLINTYQR